MQRLVEGVAADRDRAGRNDEVEQRIPAAPVTREEHDAGERDQDVHDQDADRRARRHPDEVGDRVVVMREDRPQQQGHDERERDARPRCLEARMRPCEHAWQPAFATHRVQRSRREVQTAERGGEAGGGDGEVDDHREPVADVARRERVEGCGILRPRARVADAEAYGHHPRDEDVVDERDEHRCENRLGDGAERVRGLLAEHGRRLEADEAGEGEDDREEEIARRRGLRRVERLQRQARVAALEEDDEREQEDRADADRGGDQLDPRGDADVEEREHREPAEEDEEPRIPAPVDPGVRAHRDRHEERADHEHEGDADGERAAVQPPAEKACAGVEPARDVRVEPAGTRHAAREPDDHRRQAEAADAGDQICERRRDPRLACRGRRRERDAERERQERNRLRERVDDTEDPVTKLAHEPWPVFHCVLLSRGAERRCVPVRRSPRRPS